MLRDYLRLLKTFHQVQLSMALKSPVNLWTSTLIQIVYYFAQWLFWLGIRSTDAGLKWLSQKELIAFLVTVALVDNVYLFLIGRGSMVLLQRIQSRTLEGFLLWPRSTLGTLVWVSPNWTYFPCVVLSLLAFFAYHIWQNSSLGLIAMHFAASMIGVFIMNGISFLFRMTGFWSLAFARIRHANPSYKIMVRPYNAFDPMVRLALLVVFPALFITGVPAEIASGRFGLIWLLAAIGALALLWIQVWFMWRKGLGRYGRLVS